MKRIILLILILSLCAACAPQASETVTSTTIPTATVEATATIAASTEVPTATPPEPTVTATMMSNVRVSPADGMTQIYIPAGIVKMGGLDVFAEADELPAHEVQLDAFWIDQVEVTNGMYALCVQVGACSHPAKSNSDNRMAYFGNPEFQDYPVVYVPWPAAKAYCEWAGRRLPTEAEWERAARGDDVRTYPWGGEIPNATLSNSNNDVGDTSRVGSYAAGASPFGVLDMTGNVWEWVADYYDRDYYADSPGTNPTGPESQPLTFYRVVRGGSFQDGQRDSRISNRGYEIGPDPNAIPGTVDSTGNSSSRIGFRCAQDD
ncbi:MAG: SUMF1/EgtB/PvdO family nonheme iron enzyme [Chloroflexota bacterium]